MKPWPLRIFLGLMVVLMLLTGAVSWWSGNAQPFQAKTASYSFSVGSGGEELTENDPDGFKGVDFDSADAQRLQSDGEAGWKVTVAAEADPGVQMDYIVYFDPFPLNGVFDLADAVVYEIGPDQECLYDEDATRARDFFERVAIPTEGTFTRTYCFAAAAPKDSERREIFDRIDVSKDPGAFFSVRHSAL